MSTLLEITKSSTQAGSVPFKRFLTPAFEANFRLGTSARANIEPGWLNRMVRNNAYLLCLYLPPLC